MFLPQLYPKPISFYQSPRFVGERAEIVTQAFNPDKVQLFGVDAAFVQRIRSQLETVKFRRFGTLAGNYTLIAGGIIAVDEHGTPIKLNCDSDDDWAHSSVFGNLEDFCGSHKFSLMRETALSARNNPPLATDLPFLAEAHSSKNYYHFCTLFLPRVRHFANSANTVIGIPPTHANLPFQRDLICRTFGSRRLLPCPDMTRIKDPQLVFEPFTPEGLTWLRQNAGLRARKGDRLIYVARSTSSVSRKHGGILEDRNFMEFLERNGFETVDFGKGDIPLATQIDMLDGARIVMSAHGAGLTNIAFAEEGIGVIEILPFFWSCFTHMQIALASHLNYHGLVCSQVDQHRTMVVDTGMLAGVLERALAAG
jgi:hypothetical protein